MTVILALLLNILTTLVLGLLGVYTVTADWIAWSLISLVGLWMTRQRNRPLRERWYPVVSCLLLSTLVTVAPDRGSWVAGGWDPGVYTNEGMALARTGTFAPPDRLFSEALTPQEQELFLRRFPARTERFPGVLADAGTGTLRFEFFRLYPSAVAWVYRLGGTGGAARLNLLIGLLAVASFGTIAWSLGRFYGAAAAALLLAQPLWLYHTHVPVTEMLLLLIVGLLGLGLVNVPGRVGRSLITLGLACAVLNRFSFLPFAALFVATVAWYRVWCGVPGKAVVLEVLAYGLAVTGAAVIDLLAAPYSIMGWSILPRLLRVTLAIAVVAASACLPLDWHRLLARIRSGRPWVAGGLIVLVVAVLALGYLRPQLQDATHGNRDNLPMLTVFVGHGACWAAAAGLIFLILRPPRGHDAFIALLLFLAAVTVLMLFQKSIMDLYPWALRRYLAFTVPLLVFCGAWIPFRCWTWRGGVPWARGIAVLLIVAVPAMSWGQAWSGWTRVEYRGLDRYLDEAGGRIPPGALVVADDPRWGTPILLRHGHAVVDGKRLWSDPTGESFARALDVFARLQREGLPVLFLTSTDKGMGVYPGAAPARKLWALSPLEVNEIKHHEQARTFSAGTRVLMLHLYEFGGGD